MARILVLAPMPSELAPVVKRLRLQRGPDRVTRGTVGAHDVVALLGGIGTAKAAEVARLAIADHSPDRVVVCGIAGGLGPDVHIGDLLVPAEVTDLDTGRTSSPTPFGGAAPVGRLVTSGELITDRTVLVGHAEDGVAAIDMETAAIAAVCDDAGLPWLAFRGISDHLRDDLIDASTMTLMDADGRPNLRAVATYVVRRPANVGKLVKLGKGAGAATTAASTGLRDVLLAEG
ncbi:hypothetical protein [Aquihabitans sp. McL0605]|uniref:5'-methylthioadenosine/S-adenosylhomocysteine nucleosidase family protein n=1 Tax=Aquihabitans sp. McL0605 TaxID=3415671 RepID=UPI003CEDE4A3